MSGLPPCPAIRARRKICDLVIAAPSAMAVPVMPPAAAMAMPVVMAVMVVKDHAAHNERHRPPSAHGRDGAFAGLRGERRKRRMDRHGCRLYRADAAKVQSQYEQGNCKKMFHNAFPFHRLLIFANLVR